MAWDLLEEAASKGVRRAVAKRRGGAGKEGGGRREGRSCSGHKEGRRKQKEAVVLLEGAQGRRAAIAVPRLQLNWQPQRGFNRTPEPRQAGMAPPDKFPSMNGEN